MSDALQLEAIEFNKSVSDAATQAQAEVKALQRELNAKGLLHSGPRHIGELEILFTKMGTGIIDKAIAKRKELGRRLPELLTQPLLDDLRDKLHKHLDGVVRGQRTRSEIGGQAPGGGISRALNSQAEQRASALKVRATQGLEILRLETRVGIHEEEKPVMFNISNSTIASLNLGTVVGDLTASVQTLNNQGQQELASIIQTLAEALAETAELQEARRKELLEHLSFISTETVVPSEKRKAGPLKSSIAALREGLAEVAQLAALWPAAERILQAMGILP